MVATQYLAPTSGARALMQEQRAALAAHPERQKPAADLSRTERFLFRTKPGTVARLMHTIDTKPEDIYADERIFNFYVKRWNQRHPKDEFKQFGYTDPAKYLDDVTQANGARTIAFRPIPGTQEGYYATDNELLAGYLRLQMNRKVGEFNDVYEEDQHTVLKVGDEVFPANTRGWDSARAYALDKGIADVKIVRQDTVG